MPHEMPLVTTLVAALGLSFVLGALANRIRVPPLVGYLIAGIVVGPYTPGFVADLALVPQLAELGVILLMFGVGLHFSLKDLMSVARVAVPGALIQILCATALGVGLAAWIGWSIGAGVVFGLALSVASTVVLLRALQDRRLLDTHNGRIAVGWLVIEDLAMVLALVLLPALAGTVGAGSGETTDVEVLDEHFEVSLAGAIAITIGKVIAFVVLMLVVGRRVIPWLLHYIAHTGSRELFRLAVLAVALGVAFGAAELFDVSLALGAFFAGMIMSKSVLSQRAAEESLPFRDAFSVIFFVAVGMLFNPQILVDELVLVLATLFIIVVGKSVAACLIVVALRHPLSSGLVVSASLAQIGEFSFILAGLGVSLQLLPEEEGQNLILAGALLSIVLNPLVFLMAGWAGRRQGGAGRAVAETGESAGSQAQALPGAAGEPSVRSDAEPTTTSLSGHTILVGYGRVGSLVGEALRAAGEPLLVIEDVDRAIEGLRDEGVESILGNAARADVLAAANVAGARRLIVAIPNAFEAGQILMQARAANPAIATIARAHADGEVDHLTQLGADLVTMGEREMAHAMIAAVLETREPAGAPDAPMEEPQ